jgi:hypothetical protein
MEIGQILRAYSYYGNGLLLAQRGMLREISVEMLLASETAERAAAAQPFVFFSPEPARVLFPDDMAADLAKKLAAYQNQKAALKKELYEAVNEAEHNRLSFIRNPLKGVAQKQSDRLKALEALADDIRRGLAESAQQPTAIEPSPLPPALTAKVTALLEERIAFERDVTAKVEAIVAAARSSGVRITYTLTDAGLKYQVVPGGRGRFQADPQTLTSKMDATRAELDAIADAFGRALADFINRRAAAREEIADTLKLRKSVAIDSAIGAVARILAQQQNDSAYADYRTAVFEPGLSAEQRRLLFDAAMVQLDLPALRGEFQPMQRAETW